MYVPIEVAAFRLTLGLVGTIAGCLARNDQEVLPYRVISEYPHDHEAYTQGLAWLGRSLLESTGLYGKSQLRQLDPKSGKILRSVNLPASRFGEGITVLDDRIYQLTWRSGIAYVYDTSLTLLDSLSYPGEGWGLATDGRQLVLSDGSDSLRFLSPLDLSVERVVRVQYRGEPMTKLNELEYFEGSILANVYETDRIVRIDVSSGEIHHIIDASQLYPLSERQLGAEVMNGIAANSDGSLLITGKFWPKIFEVTLRRTP